jgi:long-chain acyl-CoA synthetase
MRYTDLDRMSVNFARGLMEHGVKPRDKICIFADTRAEWLVCAWACWRNSVALCTIYTNLGDDGIIYGINQTQAATVVTSSNLLDKLGNIMDQLPTVKTVVYFEHQLETKARSIPGAGEDVAVVPYSRLVSTGSKSTLALNPPNPQDIAIIMYTSGSTGNPKGVLITHLNMVSAIQSLTPVMLDAVEMNGSITEEDSYIAFLPLAHVLEMLAEHIMMITGIKIGYSSPVTLTDKSALVRPGDKGDCSVLQPSVMASVPLILDRIYKGIQSNVNQKGEFSRKLVSYCIAYRQDWVSRGYDTPIMNAIVFSKMREVVGGRLKGMVCGGAPLVAEPQSYISTCFGIPVLQGYGLTETTATACVSDSADHLLGHVGPPLMGVHLKILDWEEGGYTVKDKQGPRGEIAIGGSHVAAGYFLMPEKTKEEFFEEDGVRYFRTGDIGQVHEGGRVKIIDRKKDLVKLQAGEYVSLGKVESNLKINSLVENICVYADATKNAVVALVVPDEAVLQVIKDS